MVTTMFAFISLMFAIFLLASLSGMISERAGVVNVGIEGYMTIGALTFAVTGFLMNKAGDNNWTQIFALVFAVILGAAFSLLHSLVTIKLKSNQIVAGVAINILAQGIALYFATSGMESLGSNGVRISTNYNTIAMDHDSKILSIYLVISILICIAIGIYFTWTKIGKRHAAAGENPNALDAAGINVVKYRYLAALASGALAALAGAFFVINLGGFFEGSTQGVGYLALAIMIVGQWRVKYIVIGALIFSVFFGLGEYIARLDGISEAIQDNQTLFKITPFLLSLVSMAAFAKWSKTPEADGIPFEKSKR